MTAIVSFDQSAGTFVTGLYCTVGARGDAPTIVKRANTALAIAAALQALGSGDVATASASVLAAIQKNPNLDPAVALAIVNSLQVLFTQWRLLQSLPNPLAWLAPSVEKLVEDFAAGITVGAGVELQKYAPGGNAAATAKA